MTAEIDVDTLVTEDDFNRWFSGFSHTTTHALAPESWNYSAKPARQYALDQIAEVLRRRSPPVTLAELSQPEIELRLPIFYGAAEHLYQMAMTSEGDLHDTQRMIWKEKFENALLTLQPTLSESGDRVPLVGFTFERA